MKKMITIIGLLLISFTAFAGDCTFRGINNYEFEKYIKENNIEREEEIVIKACDGSNLGSICSYKHSLSFGSRGICSPNENTRINPVDGKYNCYCKSL